MTISSKLKDMISKFFAYCLLLAGSSMIAIAVWAHNHGAEPIMENALATHNLINHVASDSHIKRDIRKISKRCEELEDRLDRKRDQRTQMIISPYRNEPDVLRAKEGLDNEIKDLEKDIEQENLLLHEAEIKEDQLIAKLVTV